MTRSGIKLSHRCFKTLLVASGIFLLTLAPPGFAQTVLARNLPALGSVQPTFEVNETTLAVGDDWVMTVFHIIPSGAGLIEFGYAMAHLEPGGWLWVSEGSSTRERSRPT